MNRAAWLLAIAPIATGCLAAGEDDLDGEGAFSITVSAADTALVLDLVNYPGVDLAMLDVTAALDVRAATSIILHRDGADHVATTADDHRFASLAELDAVPWVGDAALTRLIAFARIHPVPASLTVEGVAFAGWQVEATVWGVSHATLAELDDGLELRASQNLIAGAPYASLDQIALVPYVGPAVLRGLRAESPLWWRRMHEPQGPCTVALTGRADQTASDLSLLLELSTWGDYPFAEVSSVAVTACADLTTNLAHRAALTSSLLSRATTEWGWTVESSGLAAGGTAFVNLVGQARDRIDERVADGAWAPANADEQGLLDLLPALVSTLTQGPAGGSPDYLELPMRLEAEECSQYGSALIQLSTHRIWIVHQFPRC